MILNLPSRNELLLWVSQMTNNTVEKLQHLSDGLAFCEIFHKLYPNNINLSKLKKDAKVPLEKEKNFRLLLNSINHIGLCVAINIVDLSHGKVTAILQLLQWFYKQYKNPSGKIVPGQENGSQFNASEPRIIKTYVGNLVERQRSCQKESKGKLFQNNLALSRRSVDTQLLKKTAYETDNSRKSKSIRLSSCKLNTEKKDKPSKVKSIRLSKGKFEEKCEEKRLTLKKQLNEKMSGKKSEAKSEKVVQKEETFQEVLCKVLNSQKPILQRKLIRVTEAAIQGNPQLKAKIRRIMETDSEKNQGPSKQTASPDRQVRNMLSSFRNTSEICENDTLESIPPETNSEIEYPALIEYKKPNENMHPSSIMPSIPQASNKNQTDQDKKETVKKSAIQSNELPANSPLLSQQFKEPQKCYLFDPHLSIEKEINPEAHVTDKKVESQKGEKTSEFRRQVQSQNLTASFSKVDKNVWKENQTFGQNQNLRS